MPALVVLLLLAVVIGSVIFNQFGWSFTPIASNWQSIDVAVYVTFWICGIAFVLIGLFMCWAVWRYRYREDHHSHYDPENPRLEKILTVITTIGVVAMLAPGLIVWEDYVTVPPDAVEIEVTGEQWKWSYRLPGEDGILGTAHNADIDPRSNPLGINTDDRNGDDDIIVTGGPLHIPVGRKVKILLRSKDVLHDFWIPEIRAKMDAVPGIVTYFWFQPTLVGEYEVFCAELCGVGHYSMRNAVHIDTPEDYAQWLDAQVTWAEFQAGVKPESPIVAKGRNVAQSNGCLTCHSLDGTQVVGPSWQNIWGRTVNLTDGSSIVVDEAYVRESMIEPGVKIREGFTNSMTAFELPEDDVLALLEFLKTMKPQPEPTEEPTEPVTEDPATSAVDSQ